MRLIAPPPGARLAPFRYNYSVKPLLTPTELQFFRVLQRISGDRCHLVCKPRLADFVQHHGQGFHSISQKHVDFLVCRLEDWTPMLAIELDDTSHNGAKQRERDAFVNHDVYAQIGLPLLRVPVGEMNDFRCLVSRLTNGWERRNEVLDLQ